MIHFHNDVFYRSPLPKLHQLQHPQIRLVVVASSVTLVKTQPAIRKHSSSNIATKEGCVPGTRKQILSMAINGTGISDTSRVLKVSKGTVISAIARQEDQLVSVNPNIRQLMYE